MGPRRTGTLLPCRIDADFVVRVKEQRDRDISIQQGHVPPDHLECGEVVFQFGQSVDDQTVVVFAHIEPTRIQDLGHRDCFRATIAEGRAPFTITIDGLTAGGTKAEFMDEIVRHR